MTQRKVDYKRHCRALFGSYMEAFEESEVTNDMKLRIREAIALGPAGNRQRTQKVFCLKTGLVLKCRRIVEYLMPDRVIKKVNE